MTLWNVIIAIFVLFPALMFYLVLGLMICAAVQEERGKDRHEADGK